MSRFLRVALGHFPSDWGRKLVVLIESWKCHDLVADMLDVSSASSALPPLRLGLFDSGAATTIMVVVGNASSGVGYDQLGATLQLRK
jgi:hypothetical protein